MYVVATAGHVDHGKSTLVRALTGTDPDRYAEEKRRGLTIDLGYAWTTLPTGQTVAFVDVPGHERFITTMLAGLGPAPAVLFVVAADEGWRRQSTEHLAAVDALGLRHGLLVITRSDLADPGPATAQAREELARSSLGVVPAVAVSAVTGAGLDALRTALAELVAALPGPVTDGPVRLWLDRSFTITGAGTVATGTLTAGTVRVGDELTLGERRVTVRGLQSLERPHSEVAATARVAVNLRGVDTGAVGRGDALCTPGVWPRSATVDVAVGEVPSHVLVHLGTAAVPARVRPLDPGFARLTVERSLPIRSGDRLVLRDPGRHELVGATVLDVEPPPLRRRGAARARAAELTRWQADPASALRDRLRRSEALRQRDLRDVVGAVPAGEWWVDPDAWTRWQQRIRAAVGTQSHDHPLDSRIPVDALVRSLGVPDRALVVAAAQAAGLEVSGGRVGVPGGGDLGPAADGVRRMEERLGAHPFAAPEHDDLVAWGLGVAELAAAERVGRIVRLGDGVVLLPTGPALAMRAVAALPQPFTLSEARQALGTTRRVAVPLLEHLDRRGWTRRLDGTRREVVRRIDVS